MASEIPSTSLSTSSNCIPDSNNDGNNKNSENNSKTLDFLEVAKYKNIELRYVVLHNTNPEPWFFGLFTASQLGYEDCDLVIKNLDPEFVMSYEEIRKKSPQNRALEENLPSSSLFVNIDGLQYLIFKSKCPLKREIQDWVHRELFSIIANKNNDNKNETEYKKNNAEEQYVSQLLKKLQIKELELEEQIVKNQVISEELQITKLKLEKQRVKNQEQKQHVNRLSEELQLKEVELEEERIKIEELVEELQIMELKLKEKNEKNQELENEICNMTERIVRKFQLRKNRPLEHLLCIMIKDPTQKKYDEDRGLYYIPGNKRLDHSTPEADLRFYPVRAQIKYCKERVKKLIRENGYEIVTILENPDPVNILNLLYREPQGRNTSDIVKKGNCIDMKFNIYYDKNIK